VSRALAWISATFLFGLGCVRPQASSDSIGRRNVEMNQAQGGLDRASVEGMETLRSRFEVSLVSRSMTVFARIDHAALAAQAGMTLRPTELLIFGNPRAGTPLMEASQTIGIDLPLKMLVWRDVSSATWLSYNDPAWLATRHHVEGQAALVGAMSALLSSVAGTATAPAEARSFPRSAAGTSSSRAAARVRLSGVERVAVARVASSMELGRVAIPAGAGYRPRRAARVHAYSALNAAPFRTLCPQSRPAGSRFQQALAIVLVVKPAYSCAQL
jgi:uncharacterized protein (DUF302 family)